MKKLILILALLVGGSSLWAETAVQQDQNAGFLSFGTAKSFTAYPATFTDILGQAPASTTTWIAGNPGGQYVVLPPRCKGFIMNVYGGDAVVGDPTDISTGTTPIGVVVPKGSYFKWESKNPDQTKLRFRIYMNTAAGTNGTITMCGWGL